MVTFKELLNSKQPALIALKYAVFAALSIMVNLGSQFIVDVMIAGRHDVFVALAVGTATGLIVKYVLDKRYIFFYRTETMRKDLTAFILYTSMGVITTAIFWGTELSFHFAFSTPAAKYWGGLLGLVVGYTLKFFLDRKFVFSLRCPSGGKL